jgi:hypothetical protein
MPRGGRSTRGPAADRALHRRVLWKWSILYRLRVSRWAHTRSIEPPRQGDRRMSGPSTSIPEETMQAFPLSDGYLI